MAAHPDPRHQIGKGAIGGAQFLPSFAHEPAGQRPQETGPFRTVVLDGEKTFDIMTVADEIYPAAKIRQTFGCPQRGHPFENHRIGAKGRDFRLQGMRNFFRYLCDGREPAPRPSGCIAGDTWRSQGKYANTSKLAKSLVNSRISQSRSRDRFVERLDRDLKEATSMIPRIIHQTWRDTNIPETFVPMVQSWRDQNPGWEHRLWSDEDLDRLVAENYPEFLPVFRSYSKPVERADAGRYLILHAHGGMYADLDTTCSSPLDILENEDRVVLAQEPSEHYSAHIPPREMPFLLFNGAMASPKCHPFWEDVLAGMIHNRHAKDVLESTGPMLLTGCYLRYDQSLIALHSCHLFNPIVDTTKPSADEEFGPYAPARICVHHWAGTWYTRRKRDTRLQRFQNSVRKRRALWSSYLHLNPDRELARLDLDLLRKPLPAEVDPASQNIAIFIPVRDGEEHLTRCLELIERLDLPKERIKVVFCEGDSRDRTVEILNRLLPDLAARYRDARLLKLDLGVEIDRKKRWKRQIQRRRRSAIAKVRNHLISNALDDSDDWVLWIDADVCDYPPNIVHRLLAEHEKIVVPDCVRETGGPSFDLNSFFSIETRPGRGTYEFITGGLYQPPRDHFWRRHLHDVRYLDRVPLNGVGGTMILVHASVHRAGINFPDRPYRFLIETEGFGQMAMDAGVRPIGLPNVTIYHSPS
jgi:mannosyltransferase OCH1-like enzyme